MIDRDDSPRILYVTPFWPEGPAIGSRVRSLGILRALRHMGKVEVVVLDDGDPSADSTPPPDCEFNVAYALEVEQRGNDGWIDKLRWTFDPRRRYPNGCGVGEAAMNRVLRSLDDFDLIWFFKLRSPDMFPRTAWPCSVLDMDDVPSTYERANLEVASGLRKRLQSYRMLWTWKRRENLLGDRFTVLAVCSDDDKRYLKHNGVKAPVHVIPNGFERPLSEPVRSPAEPPRIGFIGLFEYFPNREGIEWFVNECWPRIKHEAPAARLRLVGLGSDGPRKPNGPDIDGLGWLANPAEEIKTWSATVIPIRIGAGTRVKVAQAFSQKCPIVSTSLGAHGYDPVDGHNMWLADSADAFAKACIRAIREPESAAQMAERAWSEFKDKWTWDAISPRVWAAAEECLRLKTAGKAAYG